MQAIVGAALQQRVLVVILSVALMVGGVFAYKQLNIEAQNWLSNLGLDFWNQV